VRNTLIGILTAIFFMGCQVPQKNSPQLYSMANLEKEVSAHNEPIYKEYAELFDRELLKKHVWFETLQHEYGCTIHTPDVIEKIESNAPYGDRGQYKVSADKIPSRFEKFEIKKAILDKSMDSKISKLGQLAPYSINISLLLANDQGGRVVVSSHIFTSSPSAWNFEKLINGGETFGSSPFSCLFSFDPRKKYKISTANWDKINKGIIWVGMSKNELILTIGKPNKINKTVNAAGKSEQWVYGSSGQYYYLTNDKLRSWQNSK
jgi:hypothetical protein